jgi:hypothetical protein
VEHKSTRDSLPASASEMQPIRVTIALSAEPPETVRVAETVVIFGSKFIVDSSAAFIFGPKMCAAPRA